MRTAYFMSKNILTQYGIWFVRDNTVFYANRTGTVSTPKLSPDTLHKQESFTQVPRWCAIKQCPALRRALLSMNSLVGVGGDV